MGTAEKPSSKFLHDWFTSEISTVGQYQHIRLIEKDPIPNTVWPQFAEVLNHALAGVRSHLRHALRDTLAPEEYGTRADPAFGYPDYFDLITKQSIFGEILSGLIAENFPIQGLTDWSIPVWLFRNHEIAFQTLEKGLQTGASNIKTFGRSGDDALAFLSRGGAILSWLACDAYSDDGGHSF